MESTVQVTMNVLEMGFVKTRVSSFDILTITVLINPLRIQKNVLLDCASNKFVRWLLTPCNHVRTICVHLMTNALVGFNVNETILTFQEHLCLLTLLQICVILIIYLIFQTKEYNTEYANLETDH